jgi:hypothetical protein
MKRILFILLALTSNAVLSEEIKSQACSLDAQRTYAALKKVAAQDQSKLWGKSIDGAFALVNPANREAETIVSAGPALQCKRQLLAPEKPIANSCIELDGKPIASLVLPLPGDEKELIRLSTHERWHCLQKSLGLPAQGDDNAHLDTEKGRTLLRMELRALRWALDERNKDWKHAAGDAIIYRAQRSQLKKLSSDVLVEEAKLEANEGLAEYTGQRFSEMKGNNAALINRIKEADHKESYLRSFAYYTGPAYGVLLDRCKPGWPLNYKPGDDLPLMLSTCLKKYHPAMERLDLKAIGKRYGYDEVAADENAREVTRQKQLAENRALFVTGNYLQLPLEQPNIQFDPNNLFVLPDIGTIYQALTLSDNWGKLVVKGPALVDKNWQFVRVPLKENTCVLAENDGSLLLNHTYEIKSIGKTCALSNK